MQITVHIKEQEFEKAVARKNLTYERLADMLDVNRGYLSNIKNEKLIQYNPSAKLRQKVMEILGVEFDDIFVVKEAK